MVLAGALLASCAHVASGPSSSARLHSPSASSAAATPAQLESPSASSQAASPARQQNPAGAQADPLLVSNSGGSFAFRHPAEWKLTNCEDAGYVIGFNFQVGICPGESGGGFDMFVISVQGDQTSAPTRHEYVWIGTIDQQTAVQVDGVDWTRYAAHVEKDPGMGPAAGTTQIVYDVYNGTRTYIALYQHRPGQADYSSAFDDVMQHSFRLVQWSGYHSDSSGYTVDYPASWYDLSNLGAPDTEHYFANEKGIGSPIGMDAAGAMFVLSALTGSCPVPPPGNVDSTVQLTVDGQSISRVSGFLGQPQSETYWSSYATLAKGGRCFRFVFVFGSKSARDAALRVSDEIISSFTTT